MEGVVSAISAGLLTTFQFLWDSLFGLIFGFLISAFVQVVLAPRALERWLGPNARGVLNGTAFGIISSACSYGAAAAARGMYARGADIRAVFAFLISSTNMNVAIVILFWSLLGWRFAFAEFFGGIIIIAVVVTGFSLVVPRALLRHADPVAGDASECPICGMEGEAEHAVRVGGTTYLACGTNHERAMREGALDRRRDLADPATWRAVWNTMLGDVEMLRTELILGYVVAGFAAALVPSALLANVLNAVGRIPVIGYVALLALGLGIAVLTFVCSMGNVPLARFLAAAGIPLGANTTFIYGDLLVPPLIGVYRKSFPPRVVWSFIVLFAVGAMLAGAAMDALFAGRPLDLMNASMQLNDRFTLVTNSIALLTLALLWFAVNSPRRSTERE